MKLRQLIFESFADLERIYDHEFKSGNIDPVRVRRAEEDLLRQFVMINKDQNASRFSVPQVIQWLIRSNQIPKSFRKYTDVGNWINLIRGTSAGRFSNDPESRLDYFFILFNSIMREILVRKEKKTAEYDVLFTNENFTLIRIDNFAAGRKFCEPKWCTYANPDQFNDYKSKYGNQFILMINLPYGGRLRYSIHAGMRGWLITDPDNQNRLPNIVPMDFVDAMDEFEEEQVKKLFKSPKFPQELRAIFKEVADSRYWDFDEWRFG